MKLHITKWGDGATKIVLVHGGVQGTKTQGSAHFSMQEELARLGFTHSENWRSDKRALWPSGK